MSPATASPFAAEAFVLPPELEAVAPPEARGARCRADVKLMSTWQASGRLEHGRFADIVDHLDPGDLLVVNDSATVAAAVPATLDGEELELHLSTQLPGGAWAVEVRRPEGN